MPCQVVNSQSQLQARLPSLPQKLPTTQADWTAFLTSVQQWGMALQQEQHAPNVIPSQFQTFTTASATPVLAALTAVTCTPSIDASNQYYGTASLKVASITSGGTLKFTGTPISISPASRWFCSFQILAASGCTGSLTVTTSGGHTVTESFTVPSSASWQQVWGLFDLSQWSDPQATWTFTFTSTATVNLDGMQMNVIGKVLAFLPRFSGTQMILGAAGYAVNLDGVPDGVTYNRPLATALNSGQVDLSKAGVINKTLANVADSGSRFAVVNAGSMNGVSSVDSNNKALIDFTQTGHVAKNLDNIADGATYGRVKGSGLTGNVVDPSNTGILAKGNTVPMVMAGLFSYTSTTTTITMTWSAYTVYRPDGTSFNMSSGSAGPITGLTASTTYFGFFYSPESAPSTMTFVSGQAGQVGTAPVLYPPTATLAQSQYGFSLAAQLQNIYQGKISGTTTASGSGGGGGGGGGFGGGCPHEDQWVSTREGPRMAGQLEVGDELMTPDGWRPILKITHRLRGEWIAVEFDNGERVTVSPDHRFIAPDGEQIRVGTSLRLGSIVAGPRTRHLEVVGMRFRRGLAAAIQLELDDPHLYSMSPEGPLNHNQKP